MSDINAINFTDCLGIGKLAEIVAQGIGKVYEPTHLKRIANARAESIKTINNAILESDLPTYFGDGTVMIDGQDYSQLALRAKQRLAYQECKKQQNIESIVGQAASILQDAPSVDPTPVDADWISHFFDAAAHVSSTEMQQLWGKILAGEVQTPGAVSLRTLNILRTISKEEAELFSAYLSFVIKSEGSYFIWSESEVYRAEPHRFDREMLLQDCGLIFPSADTEFECKPSTVHNEIISMDNCDIIMTKMLTEETDFTLEAIFLTPAGIEICNFITHQTNQEYKLELVRHLSALTDASISFRQED